MGWCASVWGDIIEAHCCIRCWKLAQFVCSWSMWLKHPAISCYWLILLCLCSSWSTFASVCGDVHTGMKSSSPPSSLISFLPPPHLSPLQPALLYLVPSCLGIPSAVALLKGDLSAMLQWVCTQQHATVFIFSAFKLESEVRANTGYFMRAYCLICSNFNQYRTTSLLESAWKLFADCCKYL